MFKKGDIVVRLPGEILGPKYPGSTQDDFMRVGERYTVKRCNDISLTVEGSEYGWSAEAFAFVKSKRTVADVIKEMAK